MRRRLAALIATIALPLGWIGLVGWPAVSAAPQQPVTLRFYLHGDRDPIADGFSMTTRPSQPQALRLDLANAPSWYTVPVSGAFAAGAGFTLVKACTVGLSVAPTYRLALTDADGNETGQLGQATQPLSLCLGSEQVRIPVRAPVQLAGQRVKLTVSTAIGVNVSLPLGAGTYLQATNFVIAEPPPPDVLQLHPIIDGIPAGSGRGPSVTAGHTIALDVGVTNAGPADARVSEASGSFGRMTCGEVRLPPGGSTTCRASGTAAAGSQRLSTTMTAVSGDQSVSVSAVGFYFGVVLEDTVAFADLPGNVGYSSSLALDAAGNPGVSYYDATNGDLKLLRCSTPDCGGGGAAHKVTVDATGDVGQYTSLTLDAAGNPVVSYYDKTSGDLKLAHCGDPDCFESSLRTIVVVDAVGIVGRDTSLRLDAAGNPVISYYDHTNGNLKLAHCGDPTCGTGNSIVTVDAVGKGNPGLDASLRLDAAGNPVISYYDATNDNLKLAHCGDPTCGTGNSVVPVEHNGHDTSLALDAAGNPVVSFVAGSGSDESMMVLRCSDPDCGTGIRKVTVIETGPAEPEAFRDTSLALNAAGNPVVGYRANQDVRVLRCVDAYCGAGRTIVPVDYGTQPSLALHAAGNPVLSYAASSYSDQGDLLVLTCGAPTCRPGLPPAPLDDSASTAYNAAVTIDVSKNDYGIGLEITGSTPPYAGTAVLTNGRFTYTPGPDAWLYGKDNFTYTVTDDNGQKETAFVTVTISGHP